MKKWWIITAIVFAFCVTFDFLAPDKFTQAELEAVREIEYEQGCSDCAKAVRDSIVKLLDNLHSFITDPNDTMPAVELHPNMKIMPDSTWDDYRSYPHQQPIDTSRDSNPVIVITGSKIKFYSDSIWLEYDTLNEVEP